MRSVLERTGRSSAVRDLHGLCGVMTAIGEPWPAVDEADVLEACLPAQGAITVAQVQSRATGQVGEEPLAVWTLHELPVPCLLQGMAGCYHAWSTENLGGLARRGPADSVRRPC